MHSTPTHYKKDLIEKLHVQEINMSPWNLAGARNLLSKFQILAKTFATNCNPAALGPEAHEDNPPPLEEQEHSEQEEEELLDDDEMQDADGGLAAALNDADAANAANAGAAAANPAVLAPAGPVNDLNDPAYMAKIQAMIIQAMTVVGPMLDGMGNSANAIPATVGQALGFNGDGKGSWADWNRYIMNRFVALQVPRENWVAIALSLITGAAAGDAQANGLTADMP